MPMRIGVLAVQGAFIEHEQMLRRLGVEPFEIRQKKDLETPFDGLILPGGESTVMGKLLHSLGLFQPLDRMIRDGLPVFGTCAGLILLAKEISNDEKTYFASMSLRVKRNAYGRQLGSFAADAAFDGLGTIPMVFIRAPYIEAVWDGAKALAFVDEHIVAARQGNLLATAFHPELTDNPAVHGYFMEIVRNRNFSATEWAAERGIACRAGA